MHELDDFLLSNECEDAREERVRENNSDNYNSSTRRGITIRRTMIIDYGSR